MMPSTPCNRRPTLTARFCSRDAEALPRLYSPAEATTANSSCPSCPSWLISASYAGRTQNFRGARDDDGHRAASSLSIACTCHSDFENLAGSAVRRRATSGERFLLRRRSSAPDFARRFREDRGGDEKGDQSRSSVRADRGFERRSA